MHTPHYPLSSSTFSTPVPMLWPIFSRRFSRARFHALLSRSQQLPYFFFSDHSFYVLKYRYQIKVALDEIADGKEVTFKRDIYSDVYIDILGLMAKCDTSTVHRAKTKALRVQWAKIGRYVLLLLNTCQTWYMKCNLVQEWGLSRNNNRV